MKRLPPIQTNAASNAQLKRQARERKENAAELRRIKATSLDKLTPEELHRLFYYNPKQEVLFWRSRSKNIHTRPVRADSAVLVTPSGTLTLLDVIDRYMLAYKPRAPSQPKAEIPPMSKQEVLRMQRDMVPMTEARLARKAEQMKDVQPFKRKYEEPSLKTPDWIKELSQKYQKC